MVLNFQWLCTLWSKWLQEKSFLPVPRRKGWNPPRCIFHLLSSAAWGGMETHPWHSPKPSRILLYNALSPAQLYHCSLLNRTAWGFWAKQSILTVREPFFRLVLFTIPKELYLSHEAEYLKGMKHEYFHSSSL